MSARAGSIKWRLQPQISQLFCGSSSNLARFWSRSPVQCLDRPAEASENNMPFSGKTFVQCLFIGAVLAGSHGASIGNVTVVSTTTTASTTGNNSKNPISANRVLTPDQTQSPCVCLDRYKNMECGDALQSETDDARYFRFEVSKAREKKPWTL